MAINEIKFTDFNFEILFYQKWRNADFYALHVLSWRFWPSWKSSFSLENSKSLAFPLCQGTPKLLYQTK